MSPPADNESQLGGNGSNGKLARIEADIFYMRRDLDEWRAQVDKRLDRIDAIVSRLAWILVVAVIATVLAQIGLKV